LWNKPWKIKEGLAICIGLLVVGTALQLSVGSVVWHAFSFPTNLWMLVSLVVIIVVLSLLEGKVYVFNFMRTYAAAVPALIVAAVLTVSMGLIKQVPDGMESSDMMGLTNMISSWPFVLTYLYIAIILGLVVCHRLRRFRWRDIPFVMNHLGLFLFIVAATLGSADMQKLTMNVARDVPEWRAIDVQGNMVELPIAIQLMDFTIDEYPPKLILINNRTGKEVPEKKPYSLLIDDKFGTGNLGSWTVTLKKKIEDSAPAMKRDTTYYVPWKSTGAMCAVLVNVRSDNAIVGRSRKHIDRQGWVTCGSYLFPYQTLALDDSVSLVMADREPQRFVSRVQILTKKGRNVVTDIEVNHPFTIDGWKIYQLNYDTSRGKWSEISVLELVKDPWLPAVYTGIFMLAVGAVCMIFTANRRKEDKR
jgi:signal transduction histidine kinase